MTTKEATGHAPTTAKQKRRKLSEKEKKATKTVLTRFRNQEVSRGRNISFISFDMRLDNELVRLEELEKVEIYEIPPLPPIVNDNWTEITEAQAMKEHPRGHFWGATKNKEDLISDLEQTSLKGNLDYVRIWQDDKEIWHALISRTGGLSQ